MSSLSDKYIDDQLERILRAAGSSLRHYMPSSKDALRKAMRDCLKEARLLDAASSEARG